MPSLPAGSKVAGRARTLEAGLLIAGGGVLKHLVPMRWWSGILGQPAQVPAGWHGMAAESVMSAERRFGEALVAGSVRRASTRLPWEPSCLSQAIAAQVMLRRRGLAGVAVIGLRRPESDEDWEAHAWLVGSSRIVTGGQASRGFTATTVFCVRGGLQPLDLVGTDDSTSAR